MPSTPRFRMLGLAPLAVMALGLSACHKDDAATGAVRSRHGAASAGRRNLSERKHWDDDADSDADCRCRENRDKFLVHVMLVLKIMINAHRSIVPLLYYQFPSCNMALGD